MKSATDTLLGITRSGPPALPPPGATGPGVPRGRCSPPTSRGHLASPGIATEAHRAGSPRTTQPDSGLGIGFAVQGQESAEEQTMSSSGRERFERFGADAWMVRQLSSTSDPASR